MTVLPGGVTEKKLRILKQILSNQNPILPRANEFVDMIGLCGYPTVEDEVLSPEETICLFHEKRNALNARIDKRSSLKSRRS